MASERLRFLVADGVGAITLCPPEAASAVDVVLAGPPTEVVITCEATSEVPAVLIRAEDDCGLETQMERETDGIVEASPNEDHREALSPSFERRAAKIRGR